MHYNIGAHIRTPRMTQEAFSEDLPAALQAAAATAAPANAPVVASAAATPQQHGAAGLDDGQVADALRNLGAKAGDINIVANAFTVCVLHRDAPTAQWKQVCCGEFAAQALDAALPLAKSRRLFWTDTPHLPWDVNLQTVALNRAKVPTLRAWVKHSDKQTGREGDVTPAIREELTYLAAWRCQFAGCGVDLKHHAATGRIGRFSYFAHIVAASAAGPRGDPVLSKQLASDPTNFLLLCDQCHRLIDKIDPARYTTEMLRRMREDSIAAVRGLLDSLRYEHAEVIAFIGNIAGQPGQFNMADAQEALWAARLRTTDTKPRRFFDPGGHNYQVHSVAYWTSLFQVLKTDIPALQALLNGSRTGAARPRLAVYPLHGISVLLLVGRVLGDAAATHLFQPHRNALGGKTRWAWPQAADGDAPVQDKFRLKALRPYAGENEAALLVCLTSDISADRLPEPSAGSGTLLLPTLQITGEVFDKDCMQRPEDLQTFARVVDQAIQRLQDEWKVRKVHLFVSAPTTATVVIGQKMQARHHADYVCYEAMGGPGSPYAPTIEITHTSVRELVSGQAHSVALQP
jgi:hypothetical protein